MNVKILDKKVKVPKGWRRVCRGRIRTGDKVAVLDNIGNPEPLKYLKWKNIPVGGILGATDVKDFFCIIRKETK